MVIRFDILDKVTKKPKLHVALDAPSPELTSMQIRHILKVIDAVKDVLEAELGHSIVRVSFDDFGTSVFWNLILHCAVIFDKHSSTFGKKEWDIAEICSNSELAKKLQFLNLGIVYDISNNWLVLVWPEAFDGILRNFEKYALFKRIVDREKLRLDVIELPMSWWKACAEMHSFVVPKWKLPKTYLKDVLWHRPGLTLDEITVFDLAGAELPTMTEITDISDRALASKARFVKFYSEDKREFETVAPLFRQTRDSDPAKQEQQQKRLQTRKEKYEHWYLASRCLQQMWVQLTLHAGKPGRFRKYLSDKEAGTLYEAVAANIMNGIKPRDAKNFKKLSNELRVHVEDPVVPQNFKRWLELEDLLKRPDSNSDTELG